MKTYQTKQGDTFDSIAFHVLGSRRFTRELMEANSRYLDTVIFSGGVTINLPEIDDKRAETYLPPWRDR